MMKIEIIPNNIAENLCRKITKNLPEYFGIADANEHYALGVRERTNFAAKIADDHVALLSLDFPYPNNSNIYWMGVLREHQCQGIGQALIQSACAFAQAQEAKTMTVETLSPAESDEHYLKTYAFYKSCGFEPLLNLKPQGYEWNRYI